MSYRQPLYPYRLYVYGSHGFNNYFLFMHYMNQYKNDKTFIYSPKRSWVDVMSRLYTTRNNLCQRSIDTEKGISRYGSTEALNYKIVDNTDMLVAFWDPRDQNLVALKNVFTLAKKRISIIEITGDDAIIPGLETDIDTTKEQLEFSQVYGEYIDPNYHAETHTEFAMKFLSDAYCNKNLMKLIIDNKDKELIAKSKEELSIKALLYWIYRNQLCTLQEDYAILNPQENQESKKRITLHEYRHATPCEWKLEGDTCDVFTGTGMLLSHGYKSVVTFRDKTFVELKDIDIIKSHIHKSMQSYRLTENEDDCTKIIYRTSDTESYPISYQVANFETSVFKMGYWYINTDFVTTTSPTVKEN